MLVLLVQFFVALHFHTKVSIALRAIVAVAGELVDLGIVALPILAILAFLVMLVVGCAPGPYF